MTDFIMFIFRKSKGISSIIHSNFTLAWKLNQIPGTLILCIYFQPLLHNKKRERAFTLSLTGSISLLRYLAYLPIPVIAGANISHGKGMPQRFLSG